MKRQVAQLKYTHITPRKLRLVAGVMKGLPVNEAEAQLTLHPRRAAKPLLKLLHSAVADAKNNQQLSPDALVVESVHVNEGPRLKRWLPRARGHATPILKRMSHVTITLKEVEGVSPPRFKPKTSRVVRARDLEKERETRPGKKTPARPLPEKKEKVTGEPGFFRRIFRRKSV